ncbi:MAG: caspase family protein [Ancalomicrobiaceae bacterium]|nr:caspase family protein [Ancalomicrobiaceae bacterium]
MAVHGIRVQAHRYAHHLSALAMTAVLGFGAPIAPASADDSGILGGIIGGVIGGAIVSGIANQNKAQQPAGTQREATPARRQREHPVAPREAETTRVHPGKTHKPEVVEEAGPYLQDQIDLAALGFYHGGNDGKNSSSYSNAVVDYKLSKGLAAAPVLTDTERGLLHAEATQKTVLGKIGDPNQDPSSVEKPDERAQIALRELSFYDGQIDGKRKNKAYIAAVSRWQASIGKQGTGTLSVDQTKQLMTTVVTQVQTRITGINQQFASMAPVRAVPQPAQAATQPSGQPEAQPAQQPAPQIAAAPVTQRPATTPSVPQVVAVAAAPQAPTAPAPALQAPAAPAPTTQVVILPGQQKPADTQQQTFAAIEAIDPQAPVTRQWDVAVVIGNQAYQNGIPEVSYGVRDAEAMRATLINRLGFSPDNVILVENATQGDMATVFGNRESFKGKIWKYIDPDGRSKVFVFYSGHGMPDIQSRSPFILPVDANPATVTINGYPLELVYANLEKLNIQRGYVFLDACFSGGSNNKMLIQSASPVFVSANVDTGTKSNKLTIMAASDGDQLASWDDREGHGLFTEYVLKALSPTSTLSTDGQLTAAKLHEYVLENVRRQARRIYGRDQTPVLIGDSTAEIYRKQ